MVPADDPFAGTAEYYARYRPDYPDDAIRYLAERFHLDGTGRVLDLGCGTGQLAVPLAAHAGTVVGMDPNDRMLRQARERARRAGRGNVGWVRGSDAELDAVAGPLRLTTIGRAFHWTDQERTLDRLGEATEPGGGVALVGDDEWLTRGTEDWGDVVYETAADYLDGLPERTGPIEHDDPWDETLASFGFDAVETVAFEDERTWDTDAVVGYVFSLSFASPAVLGDDAAAFEADLRDRLADLDTPFVRRAETTVIAGRV